MKSIDGGSNSSGDMVVQEDTIFVSGMNAQTTEDDIANHFGAIGIIKVVYSTFFVFNFNHGTLMLNRSQFSLFTER